jgi:hypothetical protein
MAVWFGGHPSVPWAESPSLRTTSRHLEEPLAVRPLNSTQTD